MDAVENWNELVISYRLQKADALHRLREAEFGLRFAEAELDAVSPPSLAELSDRLLAAYAEYDQSQEQETQANKDLDAISEKINTLLQEQDMQMYVRDGLKFEPELIPHPSIDRELEPGFQAWLKEIGEDGIYKTDVHPKTLQAWYKRNDHLHEEISNKGFLKVFNRIRVKRPRAIKVKETNSVRKA